MFKYSTEDSPFRPEGPIHGVPEFEACRPLAPPRRLDQLNQELQRGLAARFQVRIPCLGEVEIGELPIQEQGDEAHPDDIMQYRGSVRG